MLMEYRLVSSLVLHTPVANEKTNTHGKNDSEEIRDTSLEQKQSARGKTSYILCTKKICWVLLDNHKDFI